MLGSAGGERYLLIFECKGGSDFAEPQRKMSAWEEHIRKIESGHLAVLSSDDNILREADIAGVANIRVCYAFGKGMDPEKFNTAAKLLRGRNFYAWDNTALTYYLKTAGAIRKAARFQILREFELNLEPAGACFEDAIQIRQDGLEMYLLRNQAIGPAEDCVCMQTGVRAAKRIPADPQCGQDREDLPIPPIEGCTAPQRNNHCVRR